MSNEDPDATPVTRREFVASAVAASALAIVTPPIPADRSRHTQTSSRSTPDWALRELIAGNQRFVTNHMTSAQQDLAVLRKRTLDHQSPFAAVLACADSRVPVELIFDQSIGQIFDVRLAGNIVTPEVTASLEYAVAALGVSAILVLGHTGCGAVTAAMDSKTEPGQISALYAHLRPAVQLAHGDLASAITANARLQADLLRTSSTVIRDATAKAAVRVVAGVYDLGTGKVALV